MKKIALILASGLAMASVANAADLDKGFYVSASGHYNKLTFDGLGSSAKLERSKFVPRIAIGYELGHGVRSEVSYEDLGELSGTVNVSGVKVKGTAKVKSLGFTTLVNFRTDKALQPFVGARLLYSQAKVSADASTYFASASAKTNEYSFGFGALGGLEYKVNNHIFIGSSLEYNYLASDAHSINAGVGVRYKF